mmetsp:Transcript_55994/g.157795  ORF Transcript_55994/g.157795 Transcript_55994/m.157795 type:complete len:406 (+) Transcript_55994:2061-3278(+)
MQRHVPDARVRVVHVLPQELPHLVHVALLLDELHRLLDGGQSGVLGLPAVLPRVAPYEAEEHRTHGLHGGGLDHAVHGPLAAVEELVLVLLALLVAHPGDPGLQLLRAVVDLEHQAHAGLEHELEVGRATTREPLHLLLEERHEPLQRKLLDAPVGAAVPGLCQGGEGARRLGRLRELLLEEVRLHAGHLDEGLDRLLQQILLVRLCQLLKHLHHDPGGLEERRPGHLLRLGHDAADEEERGRPYPEAAVREPQLQDLAQLLRRLDDVPLQRRDEVHEQPQGRLARLRGGAPRRVGHPEDQRQQGGPARAAPGVEAGARVVLVAHVLREHGHDLADLFLQARQRLLLKPPEELAGDVPLVLRGDPSVAEALLRALDDCLSQQHSGVPPSGFADGSIAKDCQQTQQ